MVWKNGPEKADLYVPNAAGNSIEYDARELRHAHDSPGIGAEADGSPSSETIKRKGKALEIGSGYNSMSRSEIINPRSRRTTRTATGRF